VDVGAVVLGRCGTPPGDGRDASGRGARRSRRGRDARRALGLLGAIGARLGGAPRRRAAVRVLAWGAGAMAITAAIGGLVGAGA
jgi:hypothetical protein